MILIDQVITHDSDNTGDDTVPPGIDGLDWCHIVSSVSLEELSTFLDAHFDTIEQASSNIRTPELGSLITYAGLDQEQRDAAIAAGATPQRALFVKSHSFDYPGSGATYEP